MGAGPGANSRQDDATEVCSACGVEEALRDFRGLGRIPPEEWPIARPAQKSGAEASFDTIRQEYLHVIERVGRTLAPGEDWMPVLFIEGREGRTVVGLGDLLSSDEMKAFTASALLPALLRQEQARMFGLVTTAWVVAGDLEEELPLDLSEDPRRIEAVALNVGDAQRHEVWIASIERRTGLPPQLAHWKRLRPATGQFVEPLRRAVRAKG